jgi:hypothetical protein
MSLPTLQRSDDGGNTTSETLVNSYDGAKTHINEARIIYINLNITVQSQGLGLLNGYRDVQTCSVSQITFNSSSVSNALSKYNK